MLIVRYIFSSVFLISLTSTILDDDILYDIKWQPELTSVSAWILTNEKADLIVL